MTRRATTLSLLLTALSTVGCSGDDRIDCTDIICGPCAEAITINVLLPGAPAGVTPTITGISIDCFASDPGEAICSGNAMPGSFSGSIAAPGFAAMDVSFTLEAETGGGCCSCGYVPHVETITLVPIGTSDASTSDGGPSDGGATDGSGQDAAAADGGPYTCFPERVAFPMSGTLTPGTLCDDVFACAEDAADAARIMAAAPSFTCDSAPKGPCSGYTCVLRPSTLDAAEIAEICAVTALEPTPEITCRVYL
jgi:hypothetical protein